jgi:hypothetical protein
MACGAQGYDQVRYWQGEGGLGTGVFHVASNWVQGSVPGPADLAAFNNNNMKNFGSSPKRGKTA